VSNRILERAQQQPGSSSTNPEIVRGFEVARTVYAPSTALPAAGAFTNPSAYTIQAGIRYVTFWITYTRGAAGGFALLKVLFSNGTEEGNDIVIDQSVTVAQPFGTQPIYEQVIQAPAPADANPIVFVLPVKVAVGSTNVRLLAAEGGVVGTPGTMAIAVASGT
jgi:hypothetical protein